MVVAVDPSRTQEAVRQVIPDFMHGPDFSVGICKEGAKGVLRCVGRGQNRPARSHTKHCRENCSRINHPRCDPITGRLIVGSSEYRLRGQGHIRHRRGQEGKAERNCKTDFLRFTPGQSRPEDMDRRIRTIRLVGCQGLQDEGACAVRLIHPAPDSLLQPPWDPRADQENRDSQNHARFGCDPWPCIGGGISWHDGFGATGTGRSR